MANAKWSFSSLKQYKNCPQSYYRTRVTQEFKQPDTSYTLYGKAIHKAIEEYIMLGVDFPPFYQNALSLIPTLIGLMPLQRYVERELAVDINKQPCDFRSDDYWARGIADFIGIEGDTATVIDWKTGSDKYADTDQLKLMGLLIFAHHPEVNRVKSMLYFTKTNYPVFGKDMFRTDIDTHWRSFDPELSRLDGSFASNNWPMKPSGLCGFCPVYICPHHRS